MENKKLLILSENIKMTGKQFEEFKGIVNNIVNLLHTIDKDIEIKVSGFTADYTKE